MSDDTRVNLSGLDPESDPSRLDRARQVIAARVAPSLRRRRQRANEPWAQLAPWRRPVLATATMVVVASIAVLVSPRPASVSGSNGAPATIAEAAGVPAAFASWVESGTRPSDDALLGVKD